MKKSDIQTRYIHGQYIPTINVKCYKFPHDPKSNKRIGLVEDAFKCSEKIADQALEYAWEAAQEHFWEAAQELAQEIFGSHVKVYSDGRSGGWLKGLPELDTWDARAVSKWARFSKTVKEEIEYLSAWETVKENIDANRWAEDGAQRYNFRDGKHGTVCLAEVNQAKAKAIREVERQFFGE